MQWAFDTPPRSPNTILLLCSLPPRARSVLAAATARNAARRLCALVSSSPLLLCKGSLSREWLTVLSLLCRQLHLWHPPLPLVRRRHFLLVTASSATSPRRNLVPSLRPSDPVFFVALLLLRPLAPRRRTQRNGSASQKKTQCEHRALWTRLSPTQISDPDLGF